MLDQPTGLLTDFPVVLALPVVWGDQDAFGHVNNTVYFRWFESARVDYLDRFERSHEPDSGGLGPILASVRCDFRRQVTYPDWVEIGASITRLGRSSFTMRHAVASRSQRAIVAEGDSTIVMFDYARNQSQPIPDAMRRAIEAIEGRTT
jgi:acyl-CoA thioester hydrolase